MLPFHALLAALWLPVARAIEMPVYITTPSQVTAGISFQASLDAEVHNGRPVYADFFRVYLATSYRKKAHYFYNADCYLIHEQPLCDPTIEITVDYVSFTSTPFNVTIPPTVGPSGAHYALIAQIFNTDGSWYGGKLDSEVFDLQGANGNWSDFQTAGLGSTLWGDEGIPCGSYACVKECADASKAASNSTQYHDCANNCPDVSIDFGSFTRGGQPTATLTSPSSCTVTPTSTAVDTLRTTDTNTATDSTGARSTAAGTRTNAAALSSECRISLSIGLAFLLVVVVIIG